MLRENSSFKPGDIVAIKLISGEEIIGKLIEDNNTYIKVQSPLLLILQMVDSSQYNTITGNTEPSQQAMVAFAPFMLGLRDNHVVVIEPSKFITIVKAREDAAEQFKSAVGMERNEIGAEPVNKQNFGGIQGFDSGTSFSR